METKAFALTGFLLLTVMITHAQVGIGTTNPDPSATLDVSAANKGFLPPRMTKTQRNTISNPAAGLIIWCSDCGSFGQVQVFSGAGWTDMIGGAPAGLAVGDPFGGGKVGYILQPGDPGYVPGEIHGIIATTDNQSTGIIWGCLSQLIGGTSTDLGTGQLNTDEIIDDCSAQNIAARLCDDLVLNGYSDWFLPSKDELNKIYLNQAVIGGFYSGDYWTSSEVNDQIAWVQSFVNGYQSTNFKAYTSIVRAVRTF